MRAALAAALALSGLAVSGALAAGGRMLNDGLYSEAQARRGADLYTQSCAQCHGATLEGSYDIPSLRGLLIARWAGAPLADLADYIHRAMPMFAPGALSREADADILAHVLNANGYPAGAADLPADIDKAIRIEPARTAGRQ